MFQAHLVYLDRVIPDNSGFVPEGAFADSAGVPVLLGHLVAVHGALAVTGFPAVPFHIDPSDSSDLASVALELAAFRPRWSVSRSDPWGS